MDGTLKFLSDYCSSLDYRSVPAKVVHDVKRHVVDTLGCAMAGRAMCWNFLFWIENAMMRSFFSRNRGKHD